MNMSLFTSKLPSYSGGLFILDAHWRLVVVAVLYLTFPISASAWRPLTSLDVQSKAVKDIGAKVERTGNLLGESTQLNSRYATELPRQEQEPWNFMYYGPSMDQDLTAFYGYFASVLPDALLPVEPRFDKIEENCASSPPGCSTLSHAVFKYGLLDSYYPAEFTSKVLNPLRAKYGKNAIPGVILRPWEGQAIVTYDGDESRLCVLYRVDQSPDCILDRTGKNRFIVRFQGLQVQLLLPSKRAESLVNGYLKKIYNSPSQSQGRISVVPGKKLNVESPTQSTESLLETSAPPNNDAEQLLRVCPGQNSDLESMPFLANSAKFQEHIRTYLNKTCEACTSEPLPLRSTYPAIFIFDKFGKLDAGPIPPDSPVLTHPFFSASNTDVLCLDQNPSEISHGISTIGLLLGRTPNFGVGLIPDLPRENVSLIQVSTIPELIQWISIADSEARQGNGGTVVVNISLSFEGSTYGTEKEDLARRFQAATDTVLFVVAAGIPKTQAAGVQLTSGCRIFPACLGYLPNVITVGALDKIDARSVPKIWRASNFGGEVVSIGAPAREIVSSDFQIDNDGSLKPTMSIRDGTSESAVFVTDVAARLLALQPTLSPREVKTRLLAAVGEYEEPDIDGNWLRRLFSGSAGRLAAGSLDGTRVLRSSGHEDELSLITDDKKRVGNIRVNPALKRLKFFVDEIASKGSERDCAVHAVRRIVRRDDNRVSVFCEGPSGVTYLDGVYLMPLKNSPSRANAMTCLNEADGCFSFVSNDAEQFSIRIQEVQDALFNF